MKTDSGPFALAVLLTLTIITCLAAVLLDCLLRLVF